jgi:hypothetical protein
MAGKSEEWRRAGARRVFSRRLVFARSLWLFTRAGARAAYLVRGIVQNGARRILFAARTVGAAKIRLRTVYQWFFRRGAIFSVSVGDLEMFLNRVFSVLMSDQTNRDSERKSQINLV